ncbi:MAG: DUF2059 domain-containing protein, partial [Alphaproteobacteria bacterium]|nr:DUF2059 domain-containing protein [Alphaproteobacteria bacterium]
KAAVESYIRTPVILRTIADLCSMDALQSALVLQLRASGTKLRGEQVEAVARILKEELDRLRPQLMSLLTKAAIETLSLEEIQALNEFYSTSVGASAIVKTGAMMRSFNADAAPLFQQLFERLGPRIEEEFSE